MENLTLSLIRLSVVWSNSNGKSFDCFGLRLLKIVMWCETMNCIFIRGKGCAFKIPWLSSTFFINTWIFEAVYAPCSFQHDKIHGHDGEIKGTRDAGKGESIVDGIL